MWVSKASESPTQHHLTVSGVAWSNALKEDIIPERAFLLLSGILCAVHKKRLALVPGKLELAFEKVVISLV